MNVKDVLLGLLLQQ